VAPPTAKPSASTQRQPAPAAPPALEAEGSSRSSDDDGLWESLSDMDMSPSSLSGGWETPSLKGKERRWRSKKGDKDALVAVTHLSSADPSTALCSEGRVTQLTDEQRSDETTVLFEEDRSSSLSDEAAVTTSTATPSPAGKSPTTRPPPATSTTSPSVRKRSGSAVKRAEQKQQDKQAGEKSPVAAGKPRGRGTREFNDAPPIDQPTPGLLTSIDLQLITSRVGLCVGAGRQLLARGHALAVSSTPRSQALINAHAHDSRVQLAFALLVLLVLAAAQYCWLPPTIGTIASSRWVEVPLGLALALKFNELGSRLGAFCGPVPLRHA